MLLADLKIYLLYGPIAVFPMNFSGYLFPSAIENILRKIVDDHVMPPDVKVSKNYCKGSVE